jgi:hypothetical protein
MLREATREISMRHIILALLFFAVSGSALADWVYLGSSYDDTHKNYYDPATILRSGNTSKMWTLRDRNAAAGGLSFRSFKSEDTYDCNESKKRSTAIVYYSEPMGKGNVVYRESNPETWGSVVSGSATEAMSKIACGKK